MSNKRTAPPSLAQTGKAQSGSFWKANPKSNLFPEIDKFITLDLPARQLLDEFWRHLDADMSGDFTLADLVELGFSESKAQDMWDFMRCELSTSNASISGAVYIAALRNDAIKMTPTKNVMEMVKVDSPPNHVAYVQAVMGSVNKCLVEDAVKGWCAIVLPEKLAELGKTPPTDGRFWELNPSEVAIPEMSVSLYLYEDTRLTIESLFGLLDQDKSGDITVQDFIAAGLDAAAAQEKWKVIAGLDVDGSQSIDVHELIEGLKRHVSTQAITKEYWKKGDPRNHVQCLSWVNASLNEQIKALCGTIITELNK